MSSGCRATKSIAPLVFLHEGARLDRLVARLPCRCRGGNGACGDRLLAARLRAVRSVAGEAASRLHASRKRSSRCLRSSDALAVSDPVLIGHSDGASIALIYAGMSSRPVTGLVLLAPHVFVESESITGITEAREAYATTDLPARMARHATMPARRSGSGTTCGSHRSSGTGTSRT